MSDYENLYLKAMNRIAELEAALATKTDETRMHVIDTRNVMEQRDAFRKQISQLEHEKCVLSSNYDALLGEKRRYQEECYKAINANQWHDASEPPENIIEKKMLLMELNSTTKRRYWRIGYWLSRNESLGTCIGWRDLPPTQGKESTGLRDTDWERDA